MSVRVMDAVVLRGQGKEALALGEYDAALGYFEQSLAIFRRNELENGEAEESSSGKGAKAAKLAVQRNLGTVWERWGFMMVIKM